MQQLATASIIGAALFALEQENTYAPCVPVFRKMSRETCLLAEIPDFGRVYDCGECGFIHLKVGPISVTLSPESYMQLVTLIHTSAANFEVWLLHQQGREE